jgi:hypothetical protein
MEAISATKIVAVTIYPIYGFLRRKFADLEYEKQHEDNKLKENVIPNETKR